MLGGKARSSRGKRSISSEYSISPLGNLADAGFLRPSRTFTLSAKGCNIFTGNPVSYYPIFICDEALLQFAVMTAPRVTGTSPWPSQIRLFFMRRIGCGFMSFGASRANGPARKLRECRSICWGTGDATRREAAPINGNPEIH